MQSALHLKLRENFAARDEEYLYSRKGKLWDTIDDLESGSLRPSDHPKVTEFMNQTWAVIEDYFSGDEFSLDHLRESGVLYALNAMVEDMEDAEKDDTKDEGISDDEIEAMAMRILDAISSYNP